MKHISNALNIVLMIEVVIVAVFACALLLPRIFGQEAYAVYTGSMEPAMPIGSLAYINCEIDPSDLEVGDVCAYQFGTTDEVVTHRIVAIDEKTREFTTKGDANQEADVSPVPADKIIGRVSVDIPFLGFAADELAANRLIVCGVIVATALLSAVFGWGVKRQKITERE